MPHGTLLGGYSDALTNRGCAAPGAKVGDVDPPDLPYLFISGFSVRSTRFLLVGCDSSARTFDAPASAEHCQSHAETKRLETASPNRPALASCRTSGSA